MILYHATNQRFDEFKEEFIGSNPDTHVNSHLGIWFTVEPNAMGEFATHLLKAEANLGEVVEINISQLTRWSAHWDIRLFQRCRADLIALGYGSIAFMEMDGIAHQYVILQPDRIRILEWLR